MTTDLKPTPLEDMPLETKILMGMNLHAQFLEARPIHVVLWTGSLARFTKLSSRVVAITVTDDENFTPVAEGLAMWDFDARVSNHPGATVIATSLLKSMGAAGGVTDGREGHLSETNFDVLKQIHRDAGLSLMVDLLGTDRFDVGGDLMVAWVLKDGTFYAGPAREDIESNIRAACEELFNAEAKA